MVNLQCRIFTSEIDIKEWDWNKFQPHLFTNNGYCQLLMFCCHCLPCVSPFYKNLGPQICTCAFSLSPWKKGRLVSVMYSPILLAGSVAVLGTGCTGCCVCARQLGCDMLLPRAPCHLCCLPSWVCQGAAVSMKYFNDGKVLIIATIREISNENNK